MLQSLEIFVRSQFMTLTVFLPISDGTTPWILTNSLIDAVQDSQFEQLVRGFWNRLDGQRSHNGECASKYLAANEFPHVAVVSTQIGPSACAISIEIAEAESQSFVYQEYPLVVGYLSITGASVCSKSHSQYLHPVVAPRLRRTLL